ncbi:hypothetical protein BS47DRAFT_746040 [Hydnum rufescens UP504]|uniref:Uncharacterized protein n=1 Tax=Hydnum rufescens UP504 TaxID=1448309 RepID=A0A9P6DM23_9AGAM|nr:hypothetical protein BS47DRAFT_746040 [Hydnum rufescens UP504]
MSTPRGVGLWFLGVTPLYCASCVPFGMGLENARETVKFYRLTDLSKEANNACMGWFKLPLAQGSDYNKEGRDAGRLRSDMSVVVAGKHDESGPATEANLS